jgi:hypothetical protein
VLCGKWETYPREFAKCRRCRKAKYCGKECQSTAWSEGHRFWCSAKEADGDDGEATAAAGDPGGDDGGPGADETGDIMSAFAAAAAARTERRADRQAQAQAQAQAILLAHGHGHGRGRALNVVHGGEPARAATVRAANRTATTIAPSTTTVIPPALARSRAQDASQSTQDVLTARADAIRHMRSMELFGRPLPPRDADLAAAADQLQVPTATRFMGERGPGRADARLLGEDVQRIFGRNEPLFAGGNGEESGAGTLRGLRREQNLDMVD